jgi:hypothetical protein
MKINLYEIPPCEAARLWPSLWVDFNEFRNKHLRNPNWLRISRNDWVKILQEDAQMEHIGEMITGAIAVIVDPNITDGLPSFE